MLEAYGGGGLVTSALTMTRVIQRLQGIRQPALLEPEIKADALIARGTSTEDYFSDLPFDWGQRLYPSLFPDVASSGVFDGYRFRAYPSTNTYLGTKGGRVWLYQPAAANPMTDLGAMGDYLPQAVRDTDALKPTAAAAPGAAR